MKKAIIIISIFLLIAGCTDNSTKEALDKEVTEMMGYESVEEFIDRTIDEAMKQILNKIANSLGDCVMVAQLILVQFVRVRILVPQFFLFPRLTTI